MKLLNEINIQNICKYIYILIIDYYIIIYNNILILKLYEII